jgi:anaerobic selenocysteine-containing dehydrogenase
MRESRGQRRDGIMYHVGRPGEDHFVNRAIQAWGVDGHNSHTNICSAGARTGYALWGGFDRPSPDYANAHVILLISSHLETGHYFNPHAQRIIEAKEKGARLITMDPRLSNTASKSDIWMPTWPGSETVILLAIANYLVETGRYNREFVKEWVNWESSVEHFRSLAPDDVDLDFGSPPSFEDFESLLKNLYSEFTFERAARESGVSERLIREAADAVADS